MEGTFYPKNDYRNYLEHHGIKNQKWGVRHGPPYPLDSGVSTRVKKGIKVAAKKVKSSEAYKKGAETAKKVAKKGSELYNEKMPESAKQTINKAAKKANEVYQVNKNMATNAVKSYKENYSKNKEDLKKAGVLTGTQNSSSKEVRTEIDKNSLPDWQKKDFVSGYTIENPKGFEDGTTYEEMKNKSYTTKTWTIGEEEHSISIDQTEWGVPVFKDPKMNSDRDSRKMSEKEISNLQKILIKNESKIISSALNKIANEMKETNYTDFIASKSESQIISDIKKQNFSSIRAIGYKVPKNKDVSSAEVTFFDPYSSDHILTVEFTINSRTNAIELDPSIFRMDG